jgi:hypothetical protein
MEGLLHWDFSPGLAIEKQVHRRFGSTVHFHPSSSLKEFFLVVTFSSASFVLSEETVGIALQCCIGGDRLGFRVCQTSDRHFRFSVASNKVGHFIYGLQDRVWPDFVCHFSLYRGVQSHVKGFMMPTSEAWSSHDHNVEVEERSPFKLNPSLNVLSNSTAKDLGSSDHELAKFGFSYHPKHIVDGSVKEKDQHFGSTHVGSTNISFGQFCFDIPLDQEKGSSSNWESQCLINCPNSLVNVPGVRRFKIHLRQFRQLRV